MLISEVATLYQSAVSTNKPPPLTGPIQYADFVQSQREWLQDDVLESQPRRDRNQVLQHWHNSAAEYKSDLCLHQQFEAQIERTPYAIAIVSEEGELISATH